MLNTHIHTVMTLDYESDDRVGKRIVTLVKKAPESFVPRRIIFPKRLADECTLVQLEIREQPQLLDPIPGSVLAENLISLGLPAIEVGDEIKAIVQREMGLASGHVQLSILGELSRAAEMKRLIASGYDMHKGMIGFECDESQPPAHVTTHAQSNMLYPFKPTRLCVAPECQPHFRIHDLRFGNHSNFWTADPIAASLFPVIPDDAADFIKEALRIEMPIVHVGEIVTLSCMQISGPSMSFRAALHGFMLDYRE